MGNLPGYSLPEGRGDFFFFHLPESIHVHFNVSILCKNIMTKIFEKTISWLLTWQLTWLLTWSFVVLYRFLKINTYMRNKIIIIRKKTSHLLRVGWLELSLLIKFCFNTIVCYIVACFLFFFSLQVTIHHFFLSDYSRQEVKWQCHSVLRNIWFHRIITLWLKKLKSEVILLDVSNIDTVSVLQNWTILFLLEYRQRFCTTTLVQYSHKL